VSASSSESETVLLVESVHRVTMADVDAAGVIFYVAPYLWREALFTRWLYESGHPLSSLIAAGTPTPCVSSAASYLGPIRLDDAVSLALFAERFGTSSFDLRLDGHVGDRHVVQVRTRNVWTQLREGGGLRSAPLPDWLRERFSVPGNRASDCSDESGSRMPREDQLDAVPPVRHLAAGGVQDAALGPP
jgi:acyl-CoA thioesterase FadM